MDLSTPLYDIFRENVESLMTSKHWNQTDLADEMGVTQSYVSQVLSGHRNVAFEALDKFSKALGVAPDSLIRPAKRRAARTA